MLSAEGKREATWEMTGGDGNTKESATASSKILNCPQQSFQVPSTLLVNEGPYFDQMIQKIRWIE